MKKKYKIDLLKEVKRGILPDVVALNRSRLFLIWVFLAALLLTTGLNLSEIFAGKNFVIINIFLFISALISLFFLSKKIDTLSNNKTKTYEDLEKLIKKYEREKEL